MPKPSPSRATASRKKQHVDITLSRDVRSRTKSTGLAELEFVHNALPELNLSEIVTTTRFLGHTIRLPLMISCMTGGYEDALGINRALAGACEESGIAMGVGSQRQALEDATYHRTFSVVREVAPSIPIVGNIGAAEVARMRNAGAVRRLIELIRADAFTVHLNPLQEFLQPEGSTDFRNVLRNIAMLVRDLPVPVIVKEIGAGISADVARRLLEAGVRVIDIAGAGGTSWAGVEALRSRDGVSAARFWDWGIPTAYALREVAALRSRTRRFTLIASGGLMSGIDMAKCIALGADLTAAARPMLHALHRQGRNGLRKLIAAWEHELRGVMFLTGSRTLGHLRSARLVNYGAA